MYSQERWNERGVSAASEGGAKRIVERRAGSLCERAASCQYEVQKREP